MRLLHEWQSQRLRAKVPRLRDRQRVSVLNIRLQVLWRTAESFGDFKEHVFSLGDGSSLVMRGRRVMRVIQRDAKCDIIARPSHLNARCTRRRIEIANQWSRDLAQQHGLRLLDAAQVIVLGLTHLFWHQYRDISHHTSPVTRHPFQVTRHPSHVTRHTSRHTSHVTRHTSHVTHHTSHVTGAERPQPGIL